MNECPATTEGPDLPHRHLGHLFCGRGRGGEMRYFDRYFWVVFLAIAIIALIPCFYRYLPAVVAAPGHEMRWPTQPDLLGSMVKRSRPSER